MALVAAKAAGIAVAMNYGIHVGASHLFSTICVPHSVWELARAVATTASPVCSFLLGTMQVTQNNFAVVITTTIAALATGVLRPPT